MYFTFGKNYLITESELTKDEMKNHLSKCNMGSILLGTEAEQEIDFFTIIVYLENRCKKFGIGIISEGHGLKPHILLFPSQSKLLIGFNSEVVLVDCNKGTIDCDIMLSSLFYNFIDLDHGKQTLIIHELGLIAITQEGKVIWKFDGDVIENYDIKNDTIKIELMDGKLLTLSLQTGTILTADI